MKNHALALLALLCASPAFAAEQEPQEAPKCVNLSGRYMGNNLNRAQLESVLKQTGCEKLDIKSTTAGGPSKTNTYLIDGKSHDHPEAPGKRTYVAHFEGEDGSQLVIVDTMVESGAKIERRFWIKEREYWLDGEYLVTEGKSLTGEPFSARVEQQRVTDEAPSDKKVTDSNDNPYGGDDESSEGQQSSGPSAPAGK